MKVKEASTAYRRRDHRYTYQDYLDMPDDGNRYEVIDGELVMVAAPLILHQIIASNIHVDMKMFVRRNALGSALIAPVDVVLSESDVVQPDALFIGQDRAATVTEKNVVGAPDLVVEVISPSSAYNGLIAKKDLYQEHGVLEYWIVDPKKQSVEVHAREAETLTLHQRLEGTGVVRSQVLEGFEISLGTIFSLD